jgi:hypothetical protein
MAVHNTDNMGKLFFTLFAPDSYRDARHTVTVQAGPFKYSRCEGL